MLLNHLLFGLSLDGFEGKNAWTCLAKGVITERELRNLIMAHCATHLARANKSNEPSSNQYVTEMRCDSFDLALFGRKGVIGETDVRDPWERSSDC